MEYSNLCSIFVLTTNQITIKQNDMTTGETINGYKVVGVKNIVHGKYWSNTNILAEFYVKAKKGEKFFKGYMYKDGRKNIDFKFSDTAPSVLGDLVYYGDTGTFVNPIAIV